MFSVAIKKVRNLVVFCDDTKLCTTEEKAISYAKELIANETKELAYEIENYEWIVEDSLDDTWEWIVYEDGKYWRNGEWCYDSYTEIGITELEVVQ